MGIAVVGTAAAILTFVTLRDLGNAVGITGWLAWLVPVTIDVAGIVAARVWLRGQAPPDAVKFARLLAWSCIGASISGNAGQHYMESVGLAAPWWTVVLVSAVPAATLGATVHLGHLAHRAAAPDRSDRHSPTGQPAWADVSAERLDRQDEWRDPWEDGRWPCDGRPDELTAGPNSGSRVSRREDLLAGTASDDTSHPDSTWTDADITADCGAWFAAAGDQSREAVRRRYGIGSGRADRIRTAVLTRETV
ncbi:DUF2637 domain-containing protein [Pseudonocardia sp. WMMC193]|uniref:DUF2637 domain-containing protein n=1 Tax=Pseudonocardia sp. WMMC193 TaxID=2911965 RepID=UPI001F26D689|nr:DUF2637 domain-containing protein [Pseudonocardia sp. WMMC193]MCF7548922.1 DUF2637 domain-containing protein [Pseudonocardia sp. WMMC193]